MRIGELARRVGVSTDTVRFYERSGWLPRAARQDNAYRDYAEARRRASAAAHRAAPARRAPRRCRADRRLVPLRPLRRTTGELPDLIGRRRADVAERVAGLQALDARLATLERHLVRPGRALAVLRGPSAACCDAAGAVVDPRMAAAPAVPCLVEYEMASRP